MTQRLFMLAFAFVLLSGSGLEGKTLTVASWNVKNYGLIGRYVDGVYRHNYPKPEKDKRALREVIAELSPDILLLQEFEDIAYLEEFRRDLEREGLSYPYAEILKKTNMSHCLAVISREPFEEVRLVDHLKFKYRKHNQSVLRGLMELHFETEGVRWMLFNLHLKSRHSSKGDFESRDWREGEAVAIREYIREAHPSGAEPLYFVAGDFNTHIKDDPLERFLKVGKTSLMREIPLADDSGYRWTYANRGWRVYEQVDFILASEGVFERTSPIRIQSSGILPTALESDSMPKGSDHRLIYVVLEFEEKE